VQGRRSGVCSTSRHPGLGVSLTRVVLPRLRLGSLFYFDTHTNTLRHPRRTPTLTSTPTSTHFARMQRFAGTEKQILDEPCTPVNHKQRMHKGEEGQASRHKQESCGWGCKSHFEATCGARDAMEVCRLSAMNVVLVNRPTLQASLWFGFPDVRATCRAVVHPPPTCCCS